MNWLSPALVFGLNGWVLAALIFVAVLLALIVVLYFVGRKMQKKNDAVMQEMMANSQMVSALIIDKKRMRMSEAGFPQVVIDQTPKYARRTKVAVVKAKVGPQIRSLMCDEKVFDLIPVKKEAKLKVSGIYIMDVKGVRGPLVKEETKKKGLFSRFRKK
ncbi:MAG: hypothetical protein J5872_01275 [Lachnospiraceae bacterium]|nr:hypothetical protein [Lachnospiraceae bacterium]